MIKSRTKVICIEECCGRIYGSHYFIDEYRVSKYNENSGEIIVYDLLDINGNWIIDLDIIYLKNFMPLAEYRENRLNEILN